jgi:ATP-binding cassette subfamily B protein
MTMFSGPGGGPPAGSPFAGGNSAQAGRAAGLPFAGIPPELGKRVKEIEAREPEHAPLNVPFSASELDTTPFSLPRFLWPHRAGLAFAFVLVIVATTANQAGPRLLAWAIDHGILARKPDVLVTAFIAYLVAIAVGVVTSWLRTGYTGRLGQRLMYELRLRVFAHLQRLSLDFYTEERAGRLMTRMTSDIETLANLFQDGIVDLVVQGLTLAVITAVLLTMNVKLTLVMIALIVPSMVGLTLWYTRRSDTGYARVRDRIADVLSDLSESLAGIRVMIAYGQRERSVRRHREVIAAHFEANVEMAKVGAIYAPGTELIGALGQIAMLWFGASMVARGELTLGALTAFVLYLSSFFAPIQHLVQLYTTFQSGQAAVRKLRELLATRPSVLEQPDAKPLPEVHGEIELSHVRFGYDPERPVVEDLSLSIAPGEMLAVVGPTGAGKSTLAKLVGRLYDPQGGVVTIDGPDLRGVTLHSLRTQLGVVPQEPFLFHGTLRDNLLFGRPDATDADLAEACHEVGLDEVLARMPLGLDSPVFERGASLSAGERQLIALGRALLAKPRVVVLDEATSNVDMQTEARIERAMERLLGGRTAIVIAHRLATAKRADRIAVIDGGKLVELGSHDELIARGGRYAQMYATWTAGAGERNGAAVAPPAAAK